MSRETSRLKNKWLKVISKGMKACEIDKGMVRDREGCDRSSSDSGKKTKTTRKMFCNIDVLLLNATDVRPVITGDRIFFGIEVQNRLKNDNVIEERFNCCLISVFFALIFYKGNKSFCCMLPGE